jgi:beta-phosphoglucomutase
MERDQRRAVLWDLDGTIVDTLELHWQSWLDTLQPEGVKVSREQFLATFGQRNVSFLPGWLGESRDSERVKRISEAKEAAFRRLIRERGLTALPGAVEWITKLNARGWLQAIASSAPRLNVEAMLEALDIQSDFQAIVSADDVTAGKPDPEVFLKAAEKLKVPPSRCIVVEDAPAGIEAARRAGMRSIGVGAGKEPLPADLFTGSLAALAPDAFDRLVTTP